MSVAVGQEYLCKICGNQIKVVAAGAGLRVCCGIANHP
jgi:desulfoferrodoxin-like iron-binding protein